MKINGMGKSDERMREASMKTSNYSWLQRIFFVLLLIGAFVIAPVSQTEAASAISGKVYLDYTGDQTAEGAPITGITVGLYNSSNTLVGAAQVTNATGAFTLSAPAAGAYTVKIDGATLPAGYGLASGSTSFTVTVDGVSASSGVKLYVKGLGGDLTIRAYGDEDADGSFSSGDSLLPGITVSVSSVTLPSFSVATNGSGVAVLKDMPTDTYTISMSNGDFMSSGYTLWGAKEGATATYGESASVVFSGTTSVDFIGRPTNTAGVDGLVAIDMDEDGSYSLAGDLPTAGAQVGLYYQESPSTRVIGTTSLTTTADGKFKFANIGLGSYVVKLDSAPTNYRVVGTGSINTTLTTTTSPSSGNNLLVEIDPSSAGAGTMPQISGFVFSNDDNTAYPGGPDSGGTGYMSVTAGDTGFKDVPVSLYKMDSGSWQLLLSQKTKADGSYSFKGLQSGDYKIVMNPSSIASNFSFVNDRDGKAPGRTVMVGGSSQAIAPYEIILPSVTAKKDQQNFWFGPIATYPTYAISTARTSNGGVAWGGLNTNTGTRDSSAGIKATFRLYEEDGVTQATSSNGSLIADVTTADGTINRVAFSGVDKQGRYIIAPLAGTYESVFIAPAPQGVSVNSANSDAGIYFYFEGRNVIAGRVYIDIVEDNVYNPSDDTPIKAIQLLVKRKAPGGSSFYNYTTLGTNSDGIYQVTNLPEGDYQISINSYGFLTDGLAGLIQYENNVDGNTANSTLQVTGLTGNTTVSGRHIWHILSSSSFEIKGKAYLDLYDYGSITTQGSNGQNDVLLDGVLIELLDASGTTVLDSATTVWPACTYDFSGLSANTTYQVRASKPGLNAVISTHTVAFGATAGLNPERNFLLQGQGKFAGVFFNDRDGNQIATGGTEYVGDKNAHRIFQKKSGTWVMISNRGGNISSYYQYDYLEPGEYRLVVGAGSATAPGSVYPSSSTLIVDVDQTTIPGLIDFTITGSEQFTGQNAIYTTTASKGVSGTIFLDTNDNGIIDSEDIPLTGLSGVSVEAFYAPYFYPSYNTAGDLATAESSPKVMIAVQGDGTYEQVAGDTVGGSKPIQSTNYILRLKGLPADYTLVNDADGVSAPTTSYLPASLQGLGVIQTPMPISGQPNQNFLVKMATPQEISGRVYYDANVNSNYEAGTDAPLSGANLELWQGGVKVAATTSSGTGEYKFANVFSGTYEIRITGGVSGDYGLTGNASQPGLVIGGSDRIITDIDFAYSKSGDAAITGRVAVDLNNNGILDVNLNKTGDMVVAGVKVDLYDGATFKETTTTNAKGVYSFSALPASANYRVKIDPTIVNYQAFLNAAGTSPVDEISGINLSTPRVVTKQDFLIVGRTNSTPSGGTGGSGALNSGIKGMLFVDKNANGTYEAGTDELLPSAVTISLLDGGIEIARTQSDVATGFYQFYNLDSGSYTVKITSAITGYVISGDQDAGTIGEIAASLTTGGVAGQNFWYKAASPKGIEGYVYVDFGGNNVTPATKDTNDIGKSGVTVELYDGTGVTLMETATTDTDGKYSFPNLIYGPGVNYLVKVTLPSTDYVASAKSKAAGATQLEILINSLASTGSDDNHFFLAGVYKIDGKIWLDADGDDTYDAGEELASIPVALNWAGPDGVLGTADDVANFKSTTTATTGKYEFLKLPPGVYQVAVDRTHTSLDGTNLISTTVLPGNVEPRRLAVVAADLVNEDFGFRYAGEISGNVYQDIDGDGTKSTVDTAFGGVTVTLTNGTITVTATTAADGSYSFNNVPNGSWTISAVSTGYGFSFGEGGTVSGSTVGVTITTTSSSATGVNVGLKGTGTIKGKVVLDNDLTDGANATSVDTVLAPSIKLTLSGGSGFVTRDVFTNASGEYEINDLAPYTYTVTVQTGAADGFPAGLMVSFDPINGMTSPANGVQFTVSAAMPTLTNQDFGYKGKGEISGKILVDVEGAGTYTLADYSMGSGISVIAKNGTITKTTTTNGSGEYSFDSLSTGTWEIYLATIPTNYVFSYGEVGTVSASKVSIAIDSASATKAENVHLGYRGSASISGSLFYDRDDTDGNAYVSGTDDLFAAGYTVTLSGGTGFTPVTTTTNGSGQYTFTGLAPYANYKVTVASPSGHIASFDPDSVVVTPPAIPTGDGEAIIPIATVTEAKITQDFAFKGAGKIAGKIYTDLNDNGIYNSGIDQPKNGITVTLTHATLPARTATTDASGDYVVTGVVAEEWTVAITGGTSGLRAPSFDYDDAYNPSGVPATPLQAVVQLSSGTPIAEHVDFGFINRGKLEGVIKEDSMATALYDPSAPGIAGVTVHLVENDGVTPKAYADGTPITLTTDANGVFTVRNLDCPTSGSTYSVRIEFGPNTTGPLSTMEPSYDSDTLGVAGCGSGVNLSAGTHVVNADLVAPMAFREQADLHIGYRAIAGDILISKTAGKSTAKIGDIVPYTIKIKNQSDNQILGVTIEDLIPAGFKYVDGSARLDGVKIEDPKGNRPLRFEDIDLGGATGVWNNDSERKISYFLVVGSGVTQGEYTNRAVAKNSFNKDASNVSQATVEITSDPLFDDSLIFGKVYIDSNGNGEQDAEEEGLGGVKLATGRGEIITTDEHGRYHIPAVDGGRWERGRNFILKLDVRSLPAGYKVISDNPIVVRTSPGLPSKINFRVKEIEVKDQETTKE